MAIDQKTFNYVANKVETGLLSLFVLAIGTLLYMPQDCAIFLHVGNFREKYDMYIGAIFYLLLIILIWRLLRSKLISLIWDGIIILTRKKILRILKDKNSNHIAMRQNELALDFFLDIDNELFTSLVDKIASGLENAIPVLISSSAFIDFCTHFEVEIEKRDQLPDQIRAYRSGLPLSVLKKIDRDFIKNNYRLLRSFLTKGIPLNPIFTPMLPPPCATVGLTKDNKLQIENLGEQYIAGKFVEFKKAIEIDDETKEEK